MMAKGYKGIGMNGFIARSYDKNVKSLNMDQYKTWADSLFDWIPEKSRILGKSQIFLSD